MNIQKIFVIDTDPEIVDSLMQKIESFGLEANPVTSYEQIIDMLMQGTPDLIIMDLGFAQLEGKSFLEAIRQNLSPGDMMPPVSVMNGSNDHFLSTYAYDLGASDFHATSYDADSLQALITDYMPSEE